MKLRNKKTGEVVDLSEGFIRDIYYGKKIEIKPVAISDKEGYMYKSLAELNEEWEDYKESKEDYIRVIDSFIDYVEEADESFECDESVHKFIEKLKAWKRLKDNGFSFTGFEETDKGCLGDFTIYCYIKPDYTRPYDDVKDDLDLLFGGEE